MLPSLSQEYLVEIHAFVEQITEQKMFQRREKISDLWTQFREAEDAFLATADNRDIGLQQSEYGLALFAMNHLVLASDTAVFRRMGLPRSAITPAMWEEGNLSFLSQFRTGSGKVLKDGTLVLNIPFAQLDLGWAGSAILYFLKEIGIIRTHSFRKNPAIIDYSYKQDLSIVVIGDWGTGYWRDGRYDPPSLLNAKVINNLSPQPDIVIHLGDVYYSGTRKEEERAFVRDFPLACKADAFTLNSNHEIYCGAQGYFKTALKNRIFDKQQLTSYFALRFQSWVLIGMDSAYFDKSNFCSVGALENRSHVQRDFVKALNISEKGKILLFTHHHGMDYSGTTLNEPMVNDVFSVLGNRHPDYWYYGHLHNGISYNESSKAGSLRTVHGTWPRFRCVGHSAIPVGRAELQGNPGIDYFARTAISDPDEKQEKRILNGFALLKLSPEKIEEIFYEVDPVTGIREGQSV